MFKLASGLTRANRSLGALPVNCDMTIFRNHDWPTMQDPFLLNGGSN